MVALRGTVRVWGVLTGTVSPSMTLPRYPGPYDVTPAADAQVLATKGLAMSADVSVGGMGDAIEKAERDATGPILDRTVKSYSNHEIIELGYAAFGRCTKLVDVYLPNVVKTSDYTFFGCSSLEALRLPNAVSSTYGQWPSLVEGCSSLKELRLPKAEGSLNGWHSLYGTRKLLLIEIGAMGLVSGDFSTCISLETLINRYPKVSTLSSVSTLSGTAIGRGEGYIYVPRALVEKYKVATNWSVYADQFRAIEDYPDICDPD